MQNIPLFGGSATKDAPPAGTVTSGYFPLQRLPAEQLNYYLNGATQAIQEWVNIITFAGLTPSASVQGLTAISGILTSFAAGTYANKVAFTQPASLATLTIAAGKTLQAENTVDFYGTDGNKLRTDALIRSCYQGLLMTYVSTTSFSVGVGAVGDGTFVDTMYLAATTTKTTSAWAVGSGNGGLDTGAIAATTWYYVYIIKRVDTGVVDVLFSTSATAPTMPTNYTLKRLVGAVKTNGSSQFIQFIMYADGKQYWIALAADVADGALTTARKSYTLTSIPNVQCDALFDVSSSVTGSGYIIYLAGDTNITDVAPSNGSPPIGQVSNVVTTTQPTQVVPLHMTSSTLYARSTVASTTLNATAIWFNLRPFN